MLARPAYKFQAFRMQAAETQIEAEAVDPPAAAAVPPALVKLVKCFWWPRWVDKAKYCMRPQVATVSRVSPAQRAGR